MKTLPVALAVLTSSVLLAACGPTEPPAPTAPAGGAVSVAKLDGTVSSGEGAGKISLKIANKTFEGDIASNGQFALTLPTETELSSVLIDGNKILSSIGCEGSLKSATAGAKGYGFTQLDSKRTGAAVKVLGVKADKGIVLLPPGAKVNFQLTGLVFANKATTLTGSVDCAKMLDPKLVKSLRVGVNLKLKQGWNYVYISGITDSFTSLPTEASATATITVNPKIPWQTSTDLSKSLQ